jgi:hypothetical protein
MENQTHTFIGEPRTFADKKGATKAAIRDLQKVPTDIFIADWEVQPAGERFGVLVHLDHASTEKLELTTLEGFAVVFDRAAPVDATPIPKPAPSKKRRSGEINVAPIEASGLPNNRPIAARAGSKQQLIIDLLTGGCNMVDLRRVCVKPDGVTWDDNSIRSALYFDVHQKGYGVRTVWADDVPSYFLVLPEGVDAPTEPKQPKS